MQTIPPLVNLLMEPLVVHSTILPYQFIPANYTYSFAHYPYFSSYFNKAHHFKRVIAFDTATNQMLNAPFDDIHRPYATQTTKVPLINPAQTSAQTSAQRQIQQQISNHARHQQQQQRAQQFVQNVTTRPSPGMWYYAIPAMIGVLLFNHLKQEYIFFKGLHRNHYKNKDGALSIDRFLNSEGDFAETLTTLGPTHTANEVVPPHIQYHQQQQEQQQQTSRVNKNIATVQSTTPVVTKRPSVTTTSGGTITQIDDPVQFNY